MDGSRITKSSNQRMMPIIFPCQVNAADHSLPWGVITSEEEALSVDIYGQVINVEFFTGKHYRGIQGVQGRTENFLSALIEKMINEYDGRVVKTSAYESLKVLCSIPGSNF